MAVARDDTIEHIKPLEGAIIRRYTAGSAIEAGMPVAMSSDGYVDPADGTDTTLSFALGICVTEAPAAGDRVDVVTHGPVVCMTGATPGKLEYVSDTTGAISETTGTKTTILGVAESATVLDVNPVWITLS